jgi:hypothetical protein
MDITQPTIRDKDGSLIRSSDDRRKTCRGASKTKSTKNLAGGRELKALRFEWDELRQAVRQILA